VAAKNGRLPNGFDKWELADKSGWTVKNEAERRIHLPQILRGLS
jgi:hypothetical protein